MFISQAYYCYQIRQEEASTSEVKKPAKTKNAESNERGKLTFNFLKKIAWS